jgi:hypothetical protein
MTDLIAPPGLTHPNIVAQIRAAPPLGEFDEMAAFQRMQRITFLRTLHANRNPAEIDPALRAEWAAHQQRVAAYSQVKASPPPVAPAPLPVSASVPQAPRAVVPAVPEATPALAGISSRADMLTSLLGARPTPAAPTDLV